MVKQIGHPGTLKRAVLTNIIYVDHQAGTGEVVLLVGGGYPREHLAAVLLVDLPSVYR